LLAAVAPFSGAGSALAEAPPTIRRSPPLSGQAKYRAAAVIAPTPRKMIQS